MVIADGVAVAMMSRWQWRGGGATTERGARGKGATSPPHGGCGWGEGQQVVVVKTHAAQRFWMVAHRECGEWRDGRQHRGAGLEKLRRVWHSECRCGEWKPTAGAAVGEASGSVKGQGLYHRRPVTARGGTRETRGGTARAGKSHRINFQY